MSKIEVRLNPDVLPSGSDLAIVNAARRSFNTRSEWANQSDIEESYYGPDSEVQPILKEKDKRLLEFLARGMTADDFEEFTHKVYSRACWAEVQDAENMYKDEWEGVDLSEVADLLWKWRNTPTHDTPFDHCHVSFEVKAPIFVARQLVKHEYLVMSEFSRRYITDGIQFYKPDYWRKAAPNKKQGSLEEAVGGFVTWQDVMTNSEVGGEIQGVIDDYQKSSKKLFDALINCYVAPEQARMVLPQSTLTEWTWSGSLGAFCKMCRLRLHPEAQYEARLVAQQVYNYLLEYYPVGAKFLIEGVK